jgi:hypothetical protein
MKSRAVWIASPLILVTVVTAVLAGRAGVAPAQEMAQDSGYTAPVDVDTAGLPGPVQPIFYRHDVHVTEYQMDCRYCHFAVEVSSSPGLPTMSTCMGCHLIAGLANPEVQKLREAWNEQRPIEWVEVHQMSQFVRFPHNRHVNSDKGVFEGKSTTETCVECHGPIAEMPQVYQFASLKMGWCITCHEQSEATTDCTACHY